jgi:hypothetical protein
MGQVTSRKVPTCISELQHCGSNFPIVPNNSLLCRQPLTSSLTGSILGQVIPNEEQFAGSYASGWAVVSDLQFCGGLLPSGGTLEFRWQSR